MRKTLEDIYFGNISSNEQQMAPDSELKKAVDRVTRCESQLTEQLGKDEQAILTKLIRFHDVLCKGRIYPSHTTS